MERNCLRTSFRYQRVNTRPIAGGGGGGGGEPNAPMKTQRNKLGRVEEDFINGISWPPRSYTCNFCKREFRSAQALGGHMNVHRRDRAMLRQYSPPTDGQFTNLNLNLQHNPNPNLSSSRSASLADETNKWAPAGEDNVAFSRPFNRKVSDLKRETVEIAKPNLFERTHFCGDWNKAEKIIGLGIEISTVLTDSKKDIDLELRLGYS